LVQIVRLVGAGDFLGFRRILGKQASSNTAQVVSPAVVCQIPGSSVLAALGQDAQLAQNILGAQARSLERTESHLLKLVGLSSPGRVVSLLLENSSPTPPCAVAPLTREEMAQLAGTSIESVSRLIHELARRGSLRLRGRALFVEDRAALEEFLASEYRK
jgi:CRP/FNR family transcriptional regulator